MKTLRETRTERLLTLRDLAQRAGVSFSAIHLIETARSIPRLSMIRKLSDALGVEPGDVAEFSAAIAAAGRATPRRQGISASIPLGPAVADRATDSAPPPTGA
jgi:transcriptional regulator with XRE-family HTH domain